MPVLNSVRERRPRPFRKSENAASSPQKANCPWHVKYRKSEQLIEAEGSPRKFNRAEHAKSEAIVRQHGVVLPIPIDRSGRVLAHYNVVLAARKLGYDELPVIVVDDLSDREFKGLSLALTQLYQFGSYDQQLLGGWLLEIETPELRFDAIGFDQGEVDRAIAAFTLGNTEAAEPIIGVTGPAVSRLDDVWNCDRHRIGVGDAADGQWLEHVLGGVLAAMVFADPPYGCAVRGFVTKRAHREFVQGSTTEDNEELAALFVAWCQGIKQTCRPGALVYLCIDWRGLGSLLAAAEAEFGQLLNLIVWAKDRAGMGSFYRSQHELILLFRAPGAPHQNNVQLGRHGRNRSNVWQYPGAAAFAKSGTEGDLLADHPTPKNKEMIADAILDCTKRGEVVFDPFIGSGSTLIAAEKTGRVFRGSDLDPLYVDLAVRRWQAWTGKQAVHAETGELFDDRAIAALASTIYEEGSTDE